MQINWRDTEYHFTPRTLSGGVDKDHYSNNIHAPIMGADTESVDDGTYYEPQCFQVATDWGDELLYVPKRAIVLQHFLDYVMMFENQIMEQSISCLMYFHNLEYDWLQMVKYHELLLEMAKIGTGPDEPLDLFQINNRRIILQKNALFTGNAPHFTLRIQKNKDHYFDICFRDTWTYFPTSLDKMLKDLKLGITKLDRDKELGRIDFRELDPMDPRRIEFEEYSIVDARGTKLAGEKIRDLHLEQGMKKVRVSGPSFAIASLFHKMPEEKEIVSGTEDKAAMQLVFDTYRGGRTGGIFHGQVSNISVLDFHSSYPASMVSLPSFSPSMGYVWMDGDDLHNVLGLINEYPCSFLRVDGIETDTKYPGLLTSENGKLTPVYGEFSNIATTGIELATAVNSGTLTITKVHECLVLVDMDENPYLPFKTFAEEAYKRKAHSEKGTAEYLSAKLALNSAYGKLIESRHSTMIGARDGNCVLPFMPGQEKVFANLYYKEYVELIKESRTFFDAYDDIIERIFEDAKAAFMEQGLSENDFMKEWESWPRECFADMSISGKEYGYNVVPAAASLITATSRARLCAAMKCLGALYWDTDSVFVPDFDPETAAEKLAIGSSWLPQGILPLTIGEDLGQLDCEMQHAYGYLAGTKRYFLTDGTFDKNGKLNVKKATHGIPSLPFEEVEKTIEALATGGETLFDSKGKAKGTGIRYEAKPKPLKAKEAGSPERIGAFEPKAYEPLFHLDERLDWEETETGWIGGVKEYERIHEAKETGPEHRT